MKDSLKSRAHKSLLQIGEKLRNEAYEQAPKKTTDLARSIIVYSPRQLEVLVGPSVEYGLYVHEGTGLCGPKHAKYKIVPDGKQALAFKLKGRSFAVGAETFKTVGRRVVVMSVMHPGIKPNPFMDRAWWIIDTWAAEKLARDMGEAVVNEIKKFKQI